MALRYALRTLRARPAYAIVVLATVALVVGPSTAVLSVLYATLVRPLPFADADRLVRIYTLPPEAVAPGGRNPLGSIDLVRFSARLTLVEGLGGVWAQQRAVGGADEPESVPTGSVTANFFNLLGAAPLRGRTFSAEEEHAGAKVTVLSYGLWERRFARDPDVIGRRISIDREDFEVIGVMGPSFSAAFVPSDLWTPLGIDEAHLILPNATFVQSVARLRPGVALPQLQAELAQAMNGIATEAPALRRGWTTDVLALRDAQFGSTTPALLLLAVAIAVLALIAVANLANLTVAEVMTRRGELALRAALGARRRDLVWINVIEASVLAAGGTLAGLILASWLLPAVLALDPTSANLLNGIERSWSVDVAAAALALGITLAAGVGAALWATSGDLAKTLGSGRTRSIGTRGQRRVRTSLVAVETVFALVLVTSGAMVVGAFRHAAAIDPGFDPHHVLGAQIRMPPAPYPTVDARATLIRGILERVRALPGVVDASTTHNLFIPGFSFVTAVGIEGKPTPDGQQHTVQFRRVSPGYFRTMKIPEIRGRTFDVHDDTTSMPVAVVSRQFADRFWPGEEVLGKRVLRGSNPVTAITVIGVVADVWDVGFAQAPAPTLYIPYAQQNVATASTGLVVRTTGEPLTLAHAVAQAIRDVDPAQPISNVTTVDQFLSDSLGSNRFRSVVLVIFASIGLVLAAVGIYGVTARAVAERTREVGLRLALGGQPGAVQRLVFRQALVGVLAGFAAGVPAAVLAAFALKHWLPDLTGMEPLPATAALGTLIVASLLATGIPVWRAGRVDPIVALRAE